MVKKTPLINKPLILFCFSIIMLNLLTHAQKQSEHDSIPRIVMGKYKAIHNEIAMPVSVEVHHAIVDGLHVGQYFEKLQYNFNHFFNQST